MRAGRGRFWFLSAFLTICVCEPSEGRTEDKTSGLYAGPLSVAAGAVVETRESGPMPDVRRMIRPRYKGTTGAVGQQGTTLEEESPLSISSAAEDRLS